MGYSGTGQTNQLAFYDHFGAELKPDVVVLVVVNNDLANNSAALESIRNGWHPLKPPRLFFHRERSQASFHPLPIAEDWSEHRPNTAYWWALHAIDAADGTRSLRTPELHCVVRHVPIPRIAGSTLYDSRRHTVVRPPVS